MRRFFYALVLKRKYFMFSTLAISGTTPYITRKLEKKFNILREFSLWLKKLNLKLKSINYWIL